MFRRRAIVEPYSVVKSRHHDIARRNRLTAAPDGVGRVVRVAQHRGGGLALAHLAQLQHDLLDDAVLIFSSDNGANGGEGGLSTPYRGGKGQGTQQEGWVRVPTIFSMPGVIPKGKDYHDLIANFDFYSTIASLAGLDIPKHCDGVDLIPYLNGSRKGDPHEYLFWLNNEPGDAVRRHLIAVRWQDWRLYKKYDKDPWQLFDLKADPREEKNIAAGNPDVVKQMASQHAAWAKTLAPLGTVSKVRPGKSDILNGHGWAIASAKDKRGKK